MASWNDLAGYIRTRYRVADDRGELMKLIFDVGGGRSQVVFVVKATLLQVDYAAISSPFASASRLDLLEAAREVSDYAVGGIAVINDRVFLRHSVPLPELDIDEFTNPLHAVVNIADLLEQKFVGSDEF